MKKQDSERFLLTKTFRRHVMLCTYTGLKTVSVKEVLKYDPRCLDAKTKVLRLLKKIDVMFAIKADTLEQVKDGIRIEKDVKARNLRTAEKRKDRPVVLRKEPISRGKNREVRIVMRSGHVLRGVQVDHYRYNLVLSINGALVLVYKHGVLAYGATPQQ